MPSQNQIRERITNTISESLKSGKPFDIKGLKDKHPPLGYDYVGFHAGSDCNARPVHGFEKTFAVKYIQGFVCEWDE